MQNNKLCCRIFPIVLILGSTVIAFGIWYFNNGEPKFAFLANKREIFNYIGSVLFIALIPIGLFYRFNDIEKYQNKARLISLLGFLPAILFLLYLTVNN